MSASSLADLQRRFQSYVRRHAGAVDFVVSDAQANAAERMDVYAHAYRLRLVEVLGNDYPALKAVAGAAEFARLGRAYLDAHPSAHRSVRWFGLHLAAFLRAREPQRPALAEIAAFEWAQGEAFDAQDASPVPLEEIARIPAAQWPELRFTPHPTLRRLDLEWNAAAIVKAVDRGEKPPEPALEGPGAWLLWRSGLSVHWRPLARDEAAALDALCAGASFGAVCEVLCEHVAPDRAAMHAASLLKRWLTDGVLGRSSFRNEDRAAS